MAAEVRAIEHEVTNADGGVAGYVRRAQRTADPDGLTVEWLAGMAHAADIPPDLRMLAHVKPRLFPYTERGLLDAAMWLRGAAAAQQRFVATTVAGADELGRLS